MNRKKFMHELERLLKDIPAGEREEAIQYYNDYFDDAGEENEARVIEELGSPAQVARTIREGMSESGGEYTERGYEDERFRNRHEVTADHQETEKEKTVQKQANANLWKILCIILLCILLCPIIIPIGVALLAVAAAVVIGIIGIAIASVAAAFALPIAGIATIAFGMYKLFLVPAVGVALGGVGCLLLAVGILVCLFALWIFSKVLPVCIRGMVALIRYPFRKAGIVK